MDIIECLLSLGSATVDSMISTAKRYSTDSNFSKEGRERYRELGEAMTIAKKSIEEYKKKKETSAFEKLYENATANSKLNGYRNNMESARVYALIETFFGGYRGADGFYFFDEQPKANWQHSLSPAIENIKRRHINFNFTPIMAIYSDLRFVFGIEGFYGLDLANDDDKVFPYSVVSKVRWDISKPFLSSEETIVFELANETQTIVTSLCQLKAKRDSEMLAMYKALCRNVIPDFIKCFGGSCKLVNR